MSGIARALLGLAGGYVAGALVGAALVFLLSGNTHDKSVEMAMTAVFVTGPLGAVIGLTVGLILGRRLRPGGRLPRS
ncbi:MAG: hypothetical protein SFW09_07680 [Hyphomicrobiaceae bacterium]|nr:hypothetical protein [Hyphomicrobiaceae bacterium]